MKPPPIKDLRGAQIIPITQDTPPEFPCWCYHSMGGFFYYWADPGYPLHDTNVKAWLKLNPSLSQAFEKPTVMELAGY